MSVVNDLVSSRLKDVMNDIVGRYVLQTRPEIICSVLSLEELRDTLIEHIKEIYDSEKDTENYIKIIRYRGIHYILKNRKNINKSNIYEILKANSGLNKAYKKIMQEKCGSAIDNYEKLEVFKFSSKTESPWGLISCGDTGYRPECQCHSITSGGYRPECQCHREGIDIMCGWCHYVMH